MSGHYEKKPCCLKCKTELKTEEVSIHQNQGHVVSFDYTFGGYKKEAQKPVFVEKKSKGVEPDDWPDDWSQEK